jgi:hypothetical protein
MRPVWTVPGARSVTAAVGAAALVSTLVAPVSAAPVRGEQRGPGDVTQAFEKHPFYTHEFGLDHPSGATYVDGPGLLAVAEKRAGGSEIVLIRPERDVVAWRMTVPGLSDPETLADDGRGTLAALEGDTLLTWPAAARGTAPVRQR